VNADCSADPAPADGTMIPAVFQLDLILFNAMNRDEAIESAENLPSSEDVLYKICESAFTTRSTLRESLSRRPLRDAPGGQQMKEALNIGLPYSG
jgi:hypothetical protein